MNQSETTSAAGGEVFDLYSALAWIDRKAYAPLELVDQTAFRFLRQFVGDAILQSGSAAPTAKGGTEVMPRERALEEALYEAVAMLEMDDEANEPGTDLYTWLRTTAPMALQPASPPPPAGAAGGGSVDLGALSAEAVAAAYYNCMIGDPKEFWPHHDGWAGKTEAFKDKVRDRMAKALKIAALSAPTLDPRGAGRAEITLYDDFPHTTETSRGWMDTAAQHLRNEEYYRGLVCEIGRMFGDTAFTDDGGELHDSVLCAKVPELVREALAKRTRPIGGSVIEEQGSPAAPGPER